MVDQSQNRATCIYEVANCQLSCTVDLWRITKRKRFRTVSEKVRENSGEQLYGMTNGSPGTIRETMREKAGFRRGNQRPAPLLTMRRRYTPCIDVGLMLANCGMEQLKEADQRGDPLGNIL